MLGAEHLPRRSRLSPAGIPKRVGTVSHDHRTRLTPRSLDPEAHDTASRSTALTPSFAFSLRPLRTLSPVKLFVDPRSGSPLVVPAGQAFCPPTHTSSRTHSDILRCCTLTTLSRRP